MWDDGELGSLANMNDDNEPSSSTFFLGKESNINNYSTLHEESYVDLAAELDTPGYNIMLEKEKHHRQMSMVSGESNGDTTTALLQCADIIVRPVSIAMTLLAWQPFKISSKFLQFLVSTLYLGFIVFVFLYDWFYNIIACEHFSFCSGIEMTTRNVLPSVLCLASFFCGLIYFRRNRGFDDSTRCLIETVFLKAKRVSDTTTTYGNLSHYQLSKELYFFLYIGVMWLTLRLITSGLFYLYIYPYYPADNPVTRIFMALSCVLASTISDAVYALTITIYGIHCYLIVFFIDSMRYRVSQRDLSVTFAAEEVTQIQKHVQNLNVGFRFPIALAILQFLTLSIVYLYTFMDSVTRKEEVVFYHKVYQLGIVLEIFSWVSILGFTLYQAAQLTARTTCVLQVGIQMRMDKYMNMPIAELDSFLLFLINTKMEARIMTYAIYPQFISKLLIIFVISLMLIIQSGLIPVSWL